jgi:hypothetical protein
LPHPKCHGKDLLQLLPGRIGDGDEVLHSQSPDNRRRSLGWVI